MRRVFATMVLAVILLIALPAMASGAPVFVSVVGSDSSGDGSIGSPYATVPHAVSQASSGDDVYVGAGTFTGNITMKNGVSLYGAGSTATTLTATWGSVITVESIGHGETISGFAITGGYAQYGGGIYIGHASPTIEDNRITGNSAGTGGAGLYSFNVSAPVIRRNTFDNNSAGSYGGGMFLSLSDCTVQDNTFEDNHADSNGGGIYGVGCSPTISGNTFSGNSAGYGGGIAGVDYFTPTISSNTLSGNSATWSGGAISMYRSSAHITSNTIRLNNARYGAGIALDYYADATIESNTIEDNVAVSAAGGIDCFRDSDAVISGNTIQRNRAPNGAGIRTSVSGSQSIVENLIRDNVASGNGGGIHLEGAGLPAVSGNTITGNTAASGGGVYADRIAVTIDANLISDNTAARGGGLNFYYYAGYRVRNNVITGNSATAVGGGILYERDSAPTIANNTIVGNSAPSGGGIWSDGSTLPRIFNCILWGNGTELVGTSAEYSCIQGGGTGTGNISTDPSFVDTAADDYRLNPGSPCLNVASAAWAPAADMLGVYRPQGAGDDIGAYEYFDAATAAPVDPALSSMTHAEGAWSSTVTVTVDLAGASGTVAPVDGYAISVSENAATTPTQTLTHDAATASHSFDVSSDGTWYLNIATVDTAGNWSAGTDFGPIPIDTTPPIDPTIVDTSHVVSAPSLLDAITVGLSGASDAGSGVMGYSVEFTGNPVDLPDTSADVLAPATSATSASLADGSWYAHVRTVDAVGNWTSTAHRGPYVIDTTGPIASDDAPTPWQSGDVTVTVDATDGVSGVASIEATVTGPGGGMTLRFVASDTMEIVVTAEGTSTIEYRATDAVGNVSASESAVVRVDKTVPLVHDDAPVGWVTDDTTLTLDVSDSLSGVAGTSYTIDGGETQSYTGPILLATDGVHEVSYWSTDVAGNVSAPELATVRIDKTAPVSSDDAPAAWVANDVTLTLTAADPLSGVAATSYQIDGGSTQPYTGPFAVTAEGITTITYWSLDAAGNTEDPQSATVRIDRTGPTASDDADPAWQQGPVTVTLSGTDAGADSSTFRYTVDDGVETTTSSTLVVTGTGVHDIAYWGIDSLGNVGPVANATVRIDDQAPSSVDDIDPAWRNGPVLVRITASDAHAGVGSVQALVTDPPPGAGSTPGTASGELTLTVSAEGTTTIEYFATDVVGNAQAPQTKLVRIDDTAPTVTIEPTATTAIDVVEFSASASDELSGIGSIYWSVDGASAQATDSVRVDTVGDHTLECWAVDIAGNESEHVTRTVRVSASETDYLGVSGSNRYETSVAASQRAFPTGADTVIVATGENWPDALGGAALAGAHDAPILLTRGDALPGEVAAELERLAPGRVFLLGGTSAISPSVEGQIRTLLAPTVILERLWGTDRFVTTEIVAARAATDGAGFDGTAFIATADSFPDALAAAPLATAFDRPLYLASPEGLQASTLAALVDAGVTDAVILGGPAAVPPTVESQLDGVGITHSRLAGADRYATALEIAKAGITKGLSWDRIALASGTDFPDALSGGVMQGHDMAVMALTQTDTLDHRVGATLEAQRDIIGELRFLGGTGALSIEVRDAVRQLLR